MADLYHWSGSDLQVGPTGDLATVDEPMLTQQRLVRRLLTNPGANIWHLEYGAGLGQMIGRPANPQRIRAIIRAQVLQEATVAPVPPPRITVDVQTDGTVTATITYTNATTGDVQSLAVPVGQAQAPGGTTLLGTPLYDSAGNLVLDSSGKVQYRS